MLQSCCGNQFRERGDGRAMKVSYSLGFGLDNETPLARLVLRRNTNRAAIRMTLLTLQAAERKHKAARGIAPVRTERHRNGDVEPRHNFPARTHPNFVAHSYCRKGIVNQQQSLSKRRTDVIGEFQRRRAGTAFLAIDDNEIRQYAGLNHGFADREKFPRMAYA